MDASDSPEQFLRLETELRELTDRQRVIDAVESRRREAFLRRQAAESGTFAGVLQDLGERRALVAVSTIDRHQLRGIIRTIGTDFVSLRAPGVGAYLVMLGAVTAVRAEPDAAPSIGDRVVSVGASLGAVLGELVADHPTVTIHTLSGDHVEGELRSSGLDVVSLRTGTSTTYVPIEAVSHCSIP
ncbi:MAG: hypothetical protein KF703_18705 [Actinobacteria bacterium]|nr:hypothetical protein [Actinomycetota bacterium]